MYSILLTVHILVTVFLIGIILMQNSASDSTGLSGSSSNSFLSGRAAASAITRATSLLATLFILSSLGLGLLTAHSHTGELSILDRLGNPTSAAVPSGKTDATAPVSPTVPTTPLKPSVPRPQ